MKVKDAIKMLSEMDQDAVLIWHDAIEGNSCEVNSLYFYLDRRNLNKEVYVSCCNKEKMDQEFLQ